MMITSFDNKLMQKLDQYCMSFEICGPVSCGRLNFWTCSHIQKFILYRYLRSNTCKKFTPGDSLGQLRIFDNFG